MCMHMDFHLLIPNERQLLSGKVWEITTYLYFDVAHNGTLLYNILADFLIYKININLFNFYL